MKNSIFAQLGGLRRTLGRYVYGRGAFESAIQNNSIELIRRDLNGKIISLSKNKVLYGPFEGLIFGDWGGWSAQDRGAMIFGLYESEVMAAFCEVAAFSGNATKLVDVGAGDGYYCVGALKSGLCSRAICFEVSEVQREGIARLAATNGVLDRLIILGAATLSFVEEVSLHAPDFIFDRDTILLMDVEGAEFDLLTEENLARLCQSTILLELHRWADPSGAKTARLRNIAEKFYYLDEFRTGARSPSFPELNSFSDDERWLLCSERRRMLGTWWRLRPKQNVVVERDTLPTIEEERPL